MAIYSSLSGQELVGKKFENLTVLSVDKVICHCICDCGVERSLRVKLLGKTKSCGCARQISNKNRALDLQGQTFERLTVVGQTEGYTNVWDCICDCGNRISVSTSALRGGNNRSCGCLWEEACREQAKKIAVSRRIAKGFPEDFQMSSFNRIERGKARPLVSKVLTRDGFCCAWCSAEKKDIAVDVHHLVPWSLSADLRFETSNMVSLCRNCHRKIHQNNHFGPVDEIMTILLKGFVNYQEEHLIKEGENIVNLFLG